MMPRAQPSGIWNSGARAEDLVRELTGADKVEKGDARGDGRLLGHWFEVKHVGGAGGAMSQVRAYKFIPLVAYFEPRRTWYVAPPNRVVYLVSRRGGQHGAPTSPSPVGKSRSTSSTRRPRSCSRSSSCPRWPWRRRT